MLQICKKKMANHEMFEKNDITELCKGVHCVDLGESFQTHIFLQNLASVQPRTSPVKFARPLAMQPLSSPGRLDDGSTLAASPRPEVRGESIRSALAQKARASRGATWCLRCSIPQSTIRPGGESFSLPS